MTYSTVNPAEIVITGTAFGGCEYNEGQRFQFSDYTSLNHLCSSPSKSLTRYRQYCTACDWLAKVWSFTRDIIHWKISGSTVTLIRTLRSSSGFLGGILCDEYSRQRINNGEHNYSLVAYYATGGPKKMAELSAALRLRTRVILSASPIVKLSPCAAILRYNVARLIPI